MEIIEFESEDGQKVSMAVIEETRINGQDYILVTEDNPEDEGVDEIEVMPLRLINDENEEIACYESIEDDDELEAITNIFAEILAEDDIELER